MLRASLLFLLACLGTAPAQAQSSNSENAAVREVITSFFDGMRQGDSAKVRRTLAPGVVFHVIKKDKASGQAALAIESHREFLKAVGTPHPEIWEERISFEQVLIDASLASVWTPYQFYVGPKFSHCGYNSFQLIKLAEGWKIAHIIDTRCKEGCK
ncbi:hypothetical protein GCM10023185_32190 [Hymenobacter saemangeumensis]|uniref:Nuclear transport factor 2 family protein n=1 Tax=Hymenobacter saemangeumensis TaxID=1084522 RepID=A0ABP8IMK2_9BACT